MRNPVNQLGVDLVICECVGVGSHGVDVVQFLKKKKLMKYNVYTDLARLFRLVLYATYTCNPSAPVVVSKIVECCYVAAFSKEERDASADKNDHLVNTFLNERMRVI